VGQVIEFYYVWKLTSHYDMWKATREPALPPDDSDEEDEPDEDHVDEAPVGKPLGKKVKG